MEADNNHLYHATWECKDHVVVFTQKYRRKVVFGKMSVSWVGDFARW